jgi:hypothetical protein
MNDTLKTYIEHYTQLECDMRELISDKGQLLCGSCTRCCCDAIICEEAIESPFLRLVHQQTDRFSDRYGFLSETGCTLEKGRPPVCYEYFCDDHFYHQPDELHAEVLKILGALLNHATREGQGDRPLAEIMQEEALDHLDFPRLEKQIQESFQALEVIRIFYRDGTLPAASYEVLKQIHPSEE